MQTKFLQPESMTNSVQYSHFRYIMSLLNDENVKMAKPIMASFRANIARLAKRELLDNEAYPGVTVGLTNNNTVHYTILGVKQHERRFKEGIYLPLEHLRREIKQMPAPDLSKCPIKPFVPSNGSESGCVAMPQAVKLEDEATVHGAGI